MSIDGTEKLHWACREAYDQVEVRSTSSHLIEIMTHWDSRSLVDTFVHIVFQIRSLYLNDKKVKRQVRITIVTSYLSDSVKRIDVQLLASIEDDPFHNPIFIFAVHKGYSDRRQLFAKQCLSAGSTVL